MVRTSISVVVPCYREGASIHPLYERVKATLDDLDEAWEIVLVDDGSPDDTFARASEIAEGDARVHVLSFSRNFGKEAAMLAGLRAAKGDSVVLMDADLQHPPELIGRLLEVMRRDGVDQVVARRNRTGDSKIRTLLSRGYYRFVNALVDDVGLEDGAGDFRALSRRAVDALVLLNESNRFSKGLFSWIGFPSATVDYENQLRGNGESAWTMGKLFEYGLDGILSFNSKPLRVMLVSGAAAIAAGLVYLLVLLVQWLVNGVEVPGYLTTVAVIVFFAGVQLLSIGVVGEYVGRIYYEVKGRPHYIVAAEVNGTSR